ncbi:hypothetical protein F0562_019810 [Nyssa sinensis]|uniref:Leucine-rich repeat-containing N-terminal plant-type domain-containing protein n=1 Tax=Nyssa sinensis TaxID=561372 RepID=A0A5J5BP87_9ASTE|nr:hypothetical protein F0562_019810 [Nyssa sinensis]
MGLLIWPYQLLGSLFFFFCCQFTCSASPFSSSAHHLCPHEQSFALLQFKQLLSINSDASLSCDDPYPKIVSWKGDTDCCSWDGVKCHRLTGHVIGLDLTCSNLKGTIHSNSSLFQLTHLQRLNLAYNDFNLSLISTEFGRFPNLTHLNLSESGFSGQIPLEIFLLSKLVSLDLSFHELGKVEPKNFKMLLQDLNQIQDLDLDYMDLSTSDFLLDSLANLSSLTSLSLSNCKLQGKFPDAIFHLPNLQTLILEENFDLTGYLPVFNCNNSCPLSFLDLSSCHFSGSIPESIGNLTKITHLFLSENEFTGQVPSTLSQLSQLVILDLSSNHLEGQIPNVFANLTHLVYLDLSSTRLTGELPDSIYHLKSLQYLSLSNCEITGSIPKSLGYLAVNGQAPSTISNVEQLTDLDQLTGYIPSNISGLPSLSVLMLSNNLLNGTIPSWLFALPSLVRLDLGSNRFSGQIHEFCHKSLDYIDLSNNELEGPMPQSIFQLVNLTHLLLSSNNLSGIVELDMFSNLQRLRVLGLSYNNRLLFSTNNNVNFTLPNFEKLLLRACKVTEFPDFLRTLGHLRVLDLSDNQIHGQIPEWLRDVGSKS